MPISMAERTHVCEETQKWVWPRPLNFEEFLDLYTGRDEIVELIDGGVVEHKAAHLNHGRLIVWLIKVLGVVAEERGLGEVLGSRSAVKIAQFRGRLPDVVYVSNLRSEVLHEPAIYGAPDLVIEVTSPSERPAGRTALEADYRSIGVAEIVFIDRKRRRVRVLRRTGEEYAETELTEGSLTLESMGSIPLPLEWLFAEKLPPVRATVARLLGEQP